MPPAPSNPRMVYGPIWVPAASTAGAPGAVRGMLRRWYRARGAHANVGSGRVQPSSRRDSDPFDDDIHLPFLVRAQAEVVAVDHLCLGFHRPVGNDLQV